MEQLVLKMEGITKIYGNGIIANNGVDFSLYAGEIHALMGENGAGKSTLMNVLFGLEKPDSGKVYVKGEAVEIDSPNKALSYGIGMVHQHFKLVPSLTVAENLVIGSEPTKGLFVDVNKARRDAAALSEKYNFDLDPMARIEDLTVGMRQKVEILKALYRGAEILILDEPTAVLTPQETEELFKELVALKNEGHTIVFISHKIREITSLCERITIMRRGKNVGVYNIKPDPVTHKEGITEQEISNLMVGREVELKIKKEKAKPGRTVLKVRKLTNVNEENKILVNRVSFSVRSGEILGIAAVEGNGQREMAEMMTGLRPIDAGTVEVDGVSISSLPLKKLRESYISHIPEDRMIYGVAAKTSIKDNLVFSAVGKKEYRKGPFIDDKKLEAAAKDMAQEYGVLCDSTQQYVSMLSGGNMQKVVVARELSERIKDVPPLIIADQPSRGIDVGATELIHRKLVELRDKGAAILLISADLAEVMGLSDSLLVLHGGEIAAYLQDVENLTEEEIGQYMLGIRKQTAQQVEGVVYE